MKKESVYRTLLSHRKRAREGREILEKGRKNLSSMETHIEGPSEEELAEYRVGFIENMQSLDRNGLRQELANRERRIEKREATEDVGTSGLHWERNIILGLLDK